MTKLTDLELTPQEMVDWANANMERVEELEAENAAIRSAFRSLKLQIAAIAGICDAATEHEGET